MRIVIHGQEIDGKMAKIRLSEPKIFADNEARGRSGHVGHAMTEFAPGKIIAFSTNTSAKRAYGHSSFGWVEYSVSEDFGESFGEVRVLPYSMELLLDGLHTVCVEKAITCEGGVIVAFCLITSQLKEFCCEPYGIPMVLISKDGGDSWEAAKPLCEYRGRVYDALYREGTAYVLMSCNDAEESFYASKPEHVYRLYKSTDNCESFTEVSTIPFNTDGRAYGNMIITESGELIAYAYNYNDEHSLDYAVSRDFGLSWDKPEVAYLKKCIRNPQVGILDGQFIMHGRAGESEGASSSFVFYTSADGKNWDEGTLLGSGKYACFYSENLTLKLPSGKEKMLVKYSENYTSVEGKWTGQVNSMMMTIETVK